MPFSIKRIFCIAAFFTILSSIVSAKTYQDPSLKVFLDNFYKNPKIEMGKFAPKFDNKGDSFDLLKSDIPISFNEKMTWRKRFIKTNSKNNKEAIGRYDRVEDLVDTKDIIKNLYILDEKKLNRANLPTIPWTGDYFALKKGQLGYRFADSKAPYRGKWKKFYKFHKEKPVSNYIRRNRINQLSPSEKYDLLIGDKEGTLTYEQWDEGRRELNEYGYVLHWAGLCHGLAHVSMNLPRPIKAVTLKSVDGAHQVKFYPDDIKGLGSLLWGHGNFDYRFIGNRCEQKKPKTDRNGRIINSSCFDNNPGTFHLAVIHQIGMSKRSFIMDSNLDYEVWNTPVVGYKISYFNPQTKQLSSVAKDVALPINNFRNDPFSSYRSPMARQIVGVQMEVKYMLLSEAEMRSQDRNPKEYLVSTRYRYDLELDAEGNILGGEWYLNKHPDFLWLAKAKANPVAPFDYQIDNTWDPTKEPLPKSWASSAIKSSRASFPSSHIIKALFKMSNAGLDGYNGRETRDNVEAESSYITAKKNFLEKCLGSVNKEAKRTVRKIKKVLKTKSCSETFGVLFKKTQLDLSGGLVSKIKDLSPLSGLINLNSLNLKNNKIFNLVPLSTLSGLSKLILSKNKVRFIKPLVNLKKLTYLDLTGNKVTDLFLLKRLENLRTLHE